MAEFPRIYRNTRYTDTFKRKTIRIEEPMLEQIQELASSRKGEQTRIINSALAEYFAKHDGYLEDPDESLFVKKTFYIEDSLRKKMIALAGDGRQQKVLHTALKLYLADPGNIAKHTHVEDWYAKPDRFWKDIKIEIED